VPDLDVLSAYWARNRNIIETESEEQIWKYRRRISQVGAERSFKIFAPLVGDKSGRRFLDIACGLGATVRKFADEGWDAQGVDADATMRSLHKELGIRSEIGQIETIKLDGTFDLVQIAHAIYFVSDPLAFLQRVKRHLAEGGVLAVVLADFMASDSLALPSYPHTFFPTTSSMRFLLALAGYRVIVCRALSGSIYLAARPGSAALPRVRPWLIRLGYRTMSLRYALMGRPKLASRRLAKSLISLVQCQRPRT
jgi:SAM-dependent methyltransferase